MKTLKCKVCGGDLRLVADQSVAECANCATRHSHDAAVVQECVSASDAEIINEVDSLLQVYKIALDGGVWSKLDSIFDHVQNIEYELAPEPEIPFIPEEDDASDAVTDEQVELHNGAQNAANAELLFEKTLTYIKQNKRFVIVAGAVASAAIIFLIILNSVIIPNGKYKGSDGQLNSGTHEEQQISNTENAEALQTVLPDKAYDDALSLMNAGKYDEAISAFDALDGHKDSAEKISECHYNKATTLLETSDTLHALSEFSKAGDYKDAPAQAAALRKVYLKSKKMQTVSAGRNHTAALKTDGTIVAVGDNDIYQCDVSGWSDIVSISVGDTHTVGLKTNGTVMHAGAINYGQRSVTEWWDIIAIRAERNHTIGLKADGTVVAAGRGDHGQCDVWSWTDITAISTGPYHTAGLKADGTVVATGNNTSGQCDVSGWTDIVAIYAGDNHTVGLKADGTVIAVGYNTYGQCDVSDWKDIVDIGIGTSYTVGLKADGSVVTVGYPYGELDQVSTWTDIVDISVAGAHIIGLRADGTVVTVNYDHNDQAAISGWTDIKRPES